MKKIMFLILSIAALFVNVSCKTDAVDEGNYAVITLCQGTEDDVYTFTLPYAGQKKIYASTGKASSDASLTAYRIKAANGYEDEGQGYQTLEIEFVPSQTDEQGNTVDPYMIVTMYNFLHQNSNTSDVPEQRNFTITKDNLFSSANYKKASAEDGTLFLSWFVDEENAVNPDSAYTSQNSTVQRYRIKGVEFKSTIINSCLEE